MLTQTLPIITRPNIVDSLAQLRQEWEQAVEGQSLVCVDASVGLILVDFITAIGLSTEEQVQVLGENLANELQDVLFSTPVSNGHH